MASNPIPEKIEEIIALALQNANGAHDLEVALGLTYNTETIIRARITLADDMREPYEEADEGIDTAFAVNEAAMKDGRALLLIARDLLKARLGSKPSTAWADAGWSDTSIAIPTKEDEVLYILRQQKRYLTDNPTFEVPAAPFVYTAAHMDTCATAIESSRAGINSAKTARDLAKAPRDAAVLAVQDGIRSLLDELKNKLDPLDPRWRTFGFNRPGAVDQPDQVVDVVITPQGGGHAHASWSPAARASYYQYWRSDAAGEVFNLEGSTSDTDRTLDAQPLGVNKYKFRAVNTEGDYGPFSEVVTVTIT